MPKEWDSRAARLTDLGLIEKQKGRTYMLSRRYYEFVGEKAAYTRKKGLDREHNLALLLKHIEDNTAEGSQLEELCQVLPSLPVTTVRSYVRTLHRRRRIHSVGRSKRARWYPGPAPSEEAGDEEG